MTYIRSNRVLVFIIAVLLVSNMVLLFFFLQKEKKEKDKAGKSTRAYMVEKLRNEVGFSDQQIGKYEDMSNKHKEIMKPLFDDIHNAKDSLYKLLLQPAPSDSLFNHYLYMVGERQKIIDQRIFAHFLSLKQLCTAEQAPKYDTVIQRVIKGMINPPKKGPGKK